MPDDLDDATLIALAQRDDRDAYGALVRRYQDVAFRTAFVIVRDASDAEDAAQSAFIKAWLAMGRFRTGSLFRPWLLQIVANEARNLGIARSRRLNRQEPDSEEAMQSVADSRPDPDLLASASEDARWLLDHLAHLRDDDRLVIACRYLLDLSETETASVLDCPRGTVKSRLSRALGRLRERVAQDVRGEVSP